MSVKIGVAGLSHMGIVMAVTFAKKGLHTVAYSDAVDRVEDLGWGLLPINEPDLDLELKSNKKRLHFTSDMAGLSGCDIIFVCVDVPTDRDGISDLTIIDEYLENINKVAGNLPVVIMSQVAVGYTRKWTKKRTAPIFYQVETLVFGQALQRALEPERIIIGTESSSSEIPNSYQALLERFDCPLLFMEYESAELTKVSINLMLVASVAATNTLAELCEKTGAKWCEIKSALQMDRRIGEYAYLTPGLGISGGNLERDLATIEQLSETKTETSIIKAFRANSRWRKGWPKRTLDSLFGDSLPDKRIALWGLAYKADTHSLKNAPSLELLKALKGKAVQIYDPVVKDYKPDCSQQVVMESALEACQEADILVIITPWNEFAEIQPRAVAQIIKHKTVLDPFGCLKDNAWRGEGFNVIQLGRPFDNDQRNES